MNIWTRIFGDGRVTQNDSDSIAIKKQNLMQEQAMGKNGWRFVDDTATYGSDTESFCAINTLSNTVFDTITGENISETNMSVPQGFLIMGHISSFKLTSGDVIAYRSVS